MINKNLILRGTLPFLNKKLLKHTFYDICDLEDENKERMKKAGITVTKEEVNEYFNNLLERYPMVKNELNKRTLIILNTLMVENYRKATNFILEEIFHIKRLDDVIEKAFRELYNFTLAYMNDETDAIEVNSDNIALYIDHKDVIFDTMSDNTFRTFMKITGIKLI